MNQYGQTVCLNMIVKNEAPVIRRCLDSVRPIIDRWVIVNTGSADGTQEIIRESLKGIPGELHQRPWVDFSHNRSEALALARGCGDYIFVIDADEVLEIEPGFQMPRLSADSYNLLIRYGGCSYLRKQLVGNTLAWRYVGVLHEYITCSEARTEEFLPGLHTSPHHDGARARDASTYRRDALVLEKALLDEPNNTRYVFYLAQSYRDAGDLELALRNYKRRIEMGGWQEEIWYSMYQIAQLKERMQHAWPEVMESYLAAFQYMPDRAGPLYRVAMHYQGKAEYQISYTFFSRAMKVARPAPNRLFVEQTMYDFQLPLEHGVACFYAGRHAEAISTNNALLRSGLTPPHAVDQVIRNRRFSIDAMFPKPAAAAQAEMRLCIVVPFRNPGPEFDDCVESLLRLEDGSFRAVFLDQGSKLDQASRLPLDDAPFTLHSASIESCVREQCDPEEIVLLLPPGHRISEPAVLKHIRSVFEDPQCELAYGQFRTPEGAFGYSEPAPSAEEFAKGGRSFAGAAAIAFRARLMGQGQNLFQAAGFAHTRFSDEVWSSEAAAVTAPRAPALLSGHLPPVSCLMVTLDRLLLAKRAILSFASQTYAERELVVVTDGSRRFRESLERYVEALGLSRDWVRFVYPDAPGLTLGQLRNISMEAARGEILCQWDDDDYSHPERLMVQAGHMLRQNAGACLLNDHLQFIEEKRIICWLDWTLDGNAKGLQQLAPGTLMMRRDRRFRYPEKGRYASQGEDSALLHAVYKSTEVAPLAGAGYLYLYQFHGRNTFSREHHYGLAKCRTSVAHLNENADKIREAARHWPIPKPCFVLGRDGPAFALN